MNNKFIISIITSVFLVNISCNMSSSPKNLLTTTANSSSTTLKFFNSNCTGALGDVKYSVLDEVAFREVNGNCWRLMNVISKAELQNTNLKGLVDSIPDARGVFIRGMNKGRNDQFSDIDTSRQVGSIQQDMVGPHKHKLNGEIFFRIEDSGMNGGVSSAFLGRNPPPTELNDGKETRPKNICLYTYIRIN